MTDSDTSRFEGVETVVRDPLHFKYKLDIGEDAFRSLRLKKYLLDAVDAGNGAIVGFGAAKSSLVASTFFAPSGFLGAIGVTTAATPLGWAVAAGFVGAGLSLVIGKHLVRGSSSRVRAIPDYINTPMDILAVGLFDLMGLLGIKLALVDGHFSDLERERLRAYFVDEWGYDAGFVDAGLAEIEIEADEHSIREVAEQLARFKKQSPDCNYASMAVEIVSFLNELNEVDGIADARGAEAIGEVQAIFDEVNRLTVSGVLTGTLDAVTVAGKKTAQTVSSAATRMTEAARQTIKKREDDPEI